LTEKFGLINVRAQGVRNIHSKLKAGSEDFSFGEFSLVHGRSGWKLVGAIAQKNIYENFRSSPAKLNVAANVLNLTNRLAGEEESKYSTSETNLFNIVSNFIIYLEGVDEAKNISSIDLAECLVLLRILSSLGYMRHDPELSIPISTSEIDEVNLESIAPKRSQMIKLINESLQASNLT